ncbi:tRNA uridine-5-carboxymethylaminomethyl(34) synthesis GTPase MnmE [Algirhabdus cladophorae]|uniref:tRNA uridine-5-carboxymethylaminomethyl(34) synthesis GTPase MnmE n=1 Tax=Algirhabdus cladophorae TaxID=3377108 RepID=UPI003B849E13
MPADTIYALASARGKAGVSIIRVSGPKALDAAKQFTVLKEIPDRPSLQRLVSTDGNTIDQALVLGFSEGASFTGEPTIEFQTHGSPAVVAKVLSELSVIDGLRPAQAGEFTRRAMENGQLDLAQVEGLADLIEAETDAQRRQAMQVFEGHLGGLAQEWRRDLVRAMALLQATIDFADEDVPEDVVPEVTDLVAGVQSSLKEQAEGYHFAERVRDGFTVAIIGPPNVGKSTLINRLAGRDIAITSDIAGTTRDTLESYIDINGLAVTFVDTAGLREGADMLETIGIERATRVAQTADIRLFLGVTDSDFSVDVNQQASDIAVWTKSDVQGARSGVLSISAKTGEGVEDLKLAIADKLETMASSASSLIRSRHLEAVNRALIELERIDIKEDIDVMPTDLYAEFLRRASDQLGTIVGDIGVEDVLDEVFASFCLGK